MWCRDGAWAFRVPVVSDYPVAPRYYIQGNKRQKGGKVQGRSLDGIPVLPAYESHFVACTTSKPPAFNPRVQLALQCFIGANDRQTVVMFCIEHSFLMRSRATAHHPADRQSYPRGNGQEFLARRHQRARWNNGEHWGVHEICWGLIAIQ